MNRKATNGLIILGVGVLVMVAGICFIAYYFGMEQIPDGTFFSNSHYFAAVIAIIGLIMSVVGCVISISGVSSSDETANTENPPLPQNSMPSVAEPIPSVAQVNVKATPTGMQTVSFSFCGNCGTRNIAGCKFCAGCGNTI